MSGGEGESGPGGPPGEPEGGSPEDTAQHPGIEPAAEGGGSGRSSAASEDTGRQVMPITALPTSDILAWLVNVLVAKAWEGMGLVPNPITNKVQKDLAEARLAIDAYAAVFEVIRLRIEEQPRREMESVLTTLRLNFVEKSGTS